MFVLPDYSLLTKAPLGSLPKLSELNKASELIDLYKKDLIPFCNQHLPVVTQKLVDYQINPDYSIDRGNFSIRSAVREHDLLILEKLFSTFQTEKSKYTGAEDFKFRVLEIDAGVSYSREAEVMSAPWLSRWLASRFSELEITISGTARLFDRSLEKDSFQIKDAVFLDCADVDRVTIRNCQFIFARQLYSRSAGAEIARVTFDNSDLSLARFACKWIEEERFLKSQRQLRSVLEVIDQEKYEQELAAGSDHIVKQAIYPTSPSEAPNIQPELSPEDLFLFLSHTLGHGGSAVINLSPYTDPLVVNFNQIPTVMSRSNILISGMI